VIVDGTIVLATMAIVALASYRHQRVDRVAADAHHGRRPEESPGAASSMACSPCTTTVFVTQLDDGLEVQSVCVHDVEDARTISGTYGRGTRGQRCAATPLVSIVRTKARVRPPPRLVRRVDGHPWLSATPSTSAAASRILPTVS
jgi:hypothetical protein